MEVINTGNLKRIGHENTEDVKVIKLFQGVFGVGGSYVYSLILPFNSSLLTGHVCIFALPGMVRTGVKTAYMWYSAGARTLGDLLTGKGGIKLTSQQQIGIRHYDGKSAFPL